MTRRSKSERTKESILGAAEVQFSQHGFGGATLDAIGERVGIKGTAILYHFATKRELYWAVLDRMFTSMLDEVHAELTGDAPLEHDSARSPQRWFASRQGAPRRPGSRR